MHEVCEEDVKESLKLIKAIIKLMSAELKEDQNIPKVKQVRKINRRRTRMELFNDDILTVCEEVSLHLLKALPKIPEIIGYVHDLNKGKL